MAQGPPRLVSVSNPTGGVIVARFNQPLDIASVGAPEAFSVRQVELDGAGVDLVGVTTSTTLPERALIRYQGGSAIDYVLRAVNARSKDGVAIDPAFSELMFELTYPDLKQLGVRLFDTIWGPLGVAQRPVDRRSADQLVTSRAIATAVKLQLQQQLASTDGRAGRDGRPGLARS